MAKDWTIKNPREANGPDGYPVDNPDFRRIADAAVEARRADAERSRLFRMKLREDLRRKGK